MHPVARRPGCLQLAHTREFLWGAFGRGGCALSVQHQAQTNTHTALHGLDLAAQCLLLLLCPDKLHIEFIVSPLYLCTDEQQDKMGPSMSFWATCCTYGARDPHHLLRDV